jgi:hypothetical protein
MIAIGVISLFMARGITASWIENESYEAYNATLPGSNPGAAQ